MWIYDLTFDIDLRHRVKGKKLNRTASHRKALLRNLAKSMIDNDTVVTTEAKAKFMRPFVDRLIKSVKKGDLASRRKVISLLGSKSSTSKLIDDVTPVLKGRTSGYLKYKRVGNRPGDNARMVRVEWMKDIPKKEESNEKKK